MVKKFIGVFALLVMVCFSSCTKDDTPVEGLPLTVEWDKTLDLSSVQTMFPEESRTFSLKAENLKSISWQNVPEGWNVEVGDDNKSLSVSAPSTGNSNEKEFAIKIVMEGVSGDSICQDIKFCFLDPALIEFDDPRGTLILNEGNMTTENGSLDYITPEGYIIDNAYRKINGTELGNVCQDMAFYDGKIYIISQNGDRNPVGTEFKNDGMLVILDAKTLKKVGAYTKEQLPGLTWPSHIAVLDDEHIYIRDNGVPEGDNGSGKIWRLNSKDGSLTEIEGTLGVPKAPLYKVGDKIYTFNILKTDFFSYFNILEISTSSDEAVISKGPISNMIPVNILPSYSSLDEFWVLFKDEAEDIYFIGKTSKNGYGRLTEFAARELDDVPNDGASGVRMVAQNDSVFYYTTGSYIIRGEYTQKYKDAGGLVGALETEELVDLSELDTNAREVYNGLGIHPVTGHLFVNTIKGMGNLYTTNTIWEFDIQKGFNEPVNKWSNYTNFPAGFFFNKR